MAEKLLQATMERERRYQEDLARLNDEIIPVLTMDLSREWKKVGELRREVGEFKRSMVIAEEDRHLTK